MLTNSLVTTILPVKNLDRAREFYETKLGLTPAGLNRDGKFLFKCAGGAIIALFPKEAGTKAEHTAVSFEVKDILKEIGVLKERGVVFENYDLPGLRTDNNVCVLGAEKAAWFKDTEGNILCIHENI